MTKHLIYRFLPVLFLIAATPIGTIEMSAAQPVSQLIDRSQWLTFE